MQSGQLAVARKTGEGVRADGKPGAHASRSIDLFLFVHSVNEIVRKSMHEQASGIHRPDASRLWLLDRKSDRPADRNEKAVPESGNRTIVVLGRRDELIARGRVK